MTENKNGGIVVAMLWMLFLSLLLCWIPIFGPLLAGLVGGKKAGGVGAAIVAVFLPAIIIGGGLFVFTSLLSGLPAIGVLAGLGGLTMALINVGPLLFGAIIGAVLSD